MPKQLDQYRQRYIQAIREVMAAHDINTYKEIADLVNSSNQTLSAILQSRQYPTVQHGIAVCKKYGYSANWLFLGKGSKFMSEQATLDKILTAIQKM